MSFVNIGLVQMACVADKEENLNKAIIMARGAAEKVHRSFVFKSCLLPYIFVMSKTMITFN